MKIKHYVITRFLSSLTLGLGERIFDEDIIQDGLSYARSYFIPSMNNQTVKDFTVIFMINDRHDTENSGIRELYDVKLEMPFKVLRKSEYLNYIMEDSKDADKVILTRMDYDDFVNCEAASEIQAMASESACDIFSYGYNTGMILYEGKLYPFVKPGYWKNGYFSIFESVCVSRKYLTPELDIYSFSHTFMKTEVKKYAEEHSITTMEMPEAESTENFVWVRHKNTGTELLTNTPVSNRKLLNVIEMDQKRFRWLFGGEL